jgi:hypothetical protein
MQALEEYQRVNEKYSEKSYPERQTKILDGIKEISQMRRTNPDRPARNYLKKAKAIPLAEESKARFLELGDTWDKLRKAVHDLTQ